MSKTGIEKRWDLFRAQRGLCHWCQQPMILRYRDGGHALPNEITIDHLDDRYSRARGQHSGQRRQVGACNKCNHQRNVEATASRPIEELWQRSGRTSVTHTAGGEG